MKRIRRPGICRFIKYAVEEPAIPAPITATSNAPSISGQTFDFAVD
jgi:hypothetical protein